MDSLVATTTLGLPPEFAADELLRQVLEVSLTGFVLYLPVYEPGTGAVVDFTFAYLSPAAQRILHLPASPTCTFRERFKQSMTNGGFVFHRDTFLTGKPGTHELLYQDEVLDGYFLCHSRRVGPGLLISVTDMVSQPLPTVAEALRASQVRERMARAEAEAQRQQLAAVIRDVPACIAQLVGPTHVFELVNPSYQALFATRSLLGKPIREALPELNLAGQPFLTMLDEVYRTGETMRGHETLAYLDRTNEGRTEIGYFDFTYQATRDDAGGITGILAFCQDVSEQVLARQRVQESERVLAAANAELQRTQESLRQLNEKLETRVATRTQELAQAQAEMAAQQNYLQRLFEQAPVAIGILRGPDYIVEVANESICALWGRTPGQALGHPLFEVLPEVAGQGFRELLDNVRRTGQPFVAPEMPAHLLRQGQLEQVHFNFVYQPLLDAWQQITAVGIVATDVSPRVAYRQQVEQFNHDLTRLNQELVARNEELAVTNLNLLRTNEDLDNFIYTASHDLRAPITNVQGLLTLLHKHLPAAPAAVAQVLALMQESVNRFQRTISHLTDVASLQREYTQLPEASTLAPIIQDVCLDLAPLLQAPDVDVQVDLANCPPVSFAPKNLRSVLYNLLSNALKYRHPDRPARVSLRGRVEGQYVVVEVKDNGLGFDMAHVARVFGMFQRLHTHVDGSGIGLYMVKKMVENAGGRIEVQSEVGVGSTFVVYLQLATADLGA